MSLRDRVSNFTRVATATVATTATLGRSKEKKQVSFSPSVAKIATVAVARTEKKVFQTSVSEVVIPTEINPWDWICPPSERRTYYAEKNKAQSCFTCKHYDGKGASWPGMCRYPKSIGRATLEIDFNVVDVAHGCQCYTTRQNTPVLVSSSDRQKLHGDDHDWITPAMCQRQTTRAKDRERISPVAAAWLRENKAALKATGWPASQLWRRNKARGICWSSRWDAPFFKAHLHDDRVIEFECVIAGRDVIQTARPMPQRNVELKEQTK